MELAHGTPRPLWSISGHKDVIKSIVFLLGGEHVITCSWDHTIRVWDTTTGEEDGTPMEHDDWVNDIAITKDGKRIVSVSDDGWVRVWEVETHELLKGWKDNGDMIYSISIAPDDELLASGSRAGTIIIREAESGEVEHSLSTDDWVWSLCFSPNGGKIASGH
ncbi:hypothetical protein HYDPIDRAFT_112837 [Hydnomerulius pinastri MD-312]|uniref:WD40 repeat-like protein n=1 Tax=Hydnomerulius pinastri MD-312 TaxID=994086 RepID=A0A0C9VZI9_9AGAM|nr:hypothetical protein HYDPIDRAFT_112837 [Hydnomerulius pinastri MD-312]